MKADRGKISDRKRQLYYDRLCNFVLSMDQKWKVDVLLREFLSDSEKIMLGRRLVIADMLRGRKRTRDIANRLGVGLDTIVFVNRWLRGLPRGSRNLRRGYSSSRRSGSSDHVKSEFEAFLDKYPGRNALLKALFGK